jgi:hypothetical protein
MKKNLFLTYSLPTGPGCIQHGHFPRPRSIRGDANLALAHIWARFASPRTIRSFCVAPLEQTPDVFSVTADKNPRRISNHCGQKRSLSDRLGRAAGMPLVVVMQVATQATVASEDFGLNLFGTCLTLAFVPMGPKIGSRYRRRPGVEYAIEHPRCLPAHHLRLDSSPSMARCDALRAPHQPRQSDVAPHGR